MIKPIIIALSLSLLWGCQSESDSQTTQAEEVSTVVEQASENANKETTEQEASAKPEMGKLVLNKDAVAEEETSFEVTVQFLNLEGGFYGLVTEDGRKLLPMNLEPEHRKAGLKLMVKGQELKGVRTIQQWGFPFELSYQKAL